MNAIRIPNVFQALTAKFPFPDEYFDVVMLSLTDSHNTTTMSPYSYSWHCSFTTKDRTEAKLLKAIYNEPKMTKEETKKLSCKIEQKNLTDFIILLKLLFPHFWM